MHVTFYEINVNPDHPKHRAQRQKGESLACGGPRIHNKVPQLEPYKRLCRIKRLGFQCRTSDLQNFWFVRISETFCDAIVGLGIRKVIILHSRHPARLSLRF